MLALSQLPEISDSERERLRNLQQLLAAVEPPSINDVIQRENLALHAQVVAAQAADDAAREE